MTKTQNQLLDSKFTHSIKLSFKKNLKSSREVEMKKSRLRNLVQSISL